MLEISLKLIPLRFCQTQWSIEKGIERREIERDSPEEQKAKGKSYRAEQRVPSM